MGSAATHSSDFGSRAIDAILAAIVSLAVWLFTLMTVGALASQILPLSEGASLSLLTTTRGDVIHNARGLTFSGMDGAIQAGVLAGSVLLAAGLTLASKPVLRRFGLLVMFGWASLWGGNAVYMGWIGKDLQMYGLAGLCSVILVFSASRLFRLW